MSFFEGQKVTVTTISRGNLAPMVNSKRKRAVVKWAAVVIARSRFGTDWWLVKATKGGRTYTVPEREIAP